MPLMVCIPSHTSDDDDDNNNKESKCRTAVDKEVEHIIILYICITPVT